MNDNLTWHKTNSNNIHSWCLKIKLFSFLFLIKITLIILMLRIITYVLSKKWNIFLRMAKKQYYHSSMLCYFMYKYLGMMFSSYFPASNVVATITLLTLKHRWHGKKMAMKEKESDIWNHYRSRTGQKQKIETTRRKQYIKACHMHGNTKGQV